MKLLKTSVAVVLAASMLWSCSKDEQEETLTTEETQEAFADAEISASFDDLDLIIDGAIEDGESAEVGGRLQLQDRHWGKCATVTQDADTRTLTVTFDGGCTDNRGNVRSGSITIARNGRMHQPGASNTATLNNFTINGKKIEGTRSLTNETANLETDPLKFRKKLEGGQVTFTNGNVATRNVNHLLVWNTGVNATQDQYDVRGVATGTNRNGVAYTNTITKDLVYKASCLATGITLPVAGQMTINVANKKLVSLDFGTNTCDNLVTVTVGGKSRTIDVSK